MFVLVTPAEIFTPGDAVFLHPAETLEHTLGEDHIDIPDGVQLTEDILDLCYLQFRKQGFEIYFVDNTLDIGHTDLEGVVRMVFLFHRI